MKFWSTIILIVFLNFTALPTIAGIFGWDLPQTNLLINEEENHGSVSIVFEKTIPKILDVNDFMKTFIPETEKKQFFITDTPIHLTAYLSIFSPPPEI